ncbi:MAG: DNA primase [Acidimicrobiales bacterium]|nr:DNA primase [Acidimicrobiaceae bacterium]MXZ16411.1 DNA primase [Acidimicrobiales bacterium]MYG62863.1 DNA primase [Acidimicrobiales bacterium]MYJ46253.1 DNA primase [Acidimicrobiales bacterium]
MSIRDSDVQRVREATDLVALIGRRVSLKRVGSRHVGLCPFHTEKTPSFSVNGAEGFYHCFGCKASGDAITFLRETEHLDFTDAVEQLAAAANIELTYDAPGAQRANQRRKELLDLLERAARFYHERLMSSPDAGEARAYLRRRGYDRETVVKWRLGYAPPLWDALCQHLGAPPDQLAAAGLAYADPASDFFRDRVMFPISDASGRVVSFAGRVLPRSGEPSPKGPKYKNTAGTAVYDKSKVLYGLHLAKQAARSTGRIVVCEGHTDVIGCELAGVFEAVATCGTALTKQHAELLSRSAKRIVLAFDADAAGQTAAERVHQWEREFGLDIFVAALPPGSDPGDLAASNPPALRRALDEAQPLHTFRAERILERADLDNPSGRDRAADEAAEVFAVYPADVLIDADLEPIARLIPMAVADLRERVESARARLTDRTQSPASDSYDAPPPPEPDEGYFDDAYSGDRWDPPEAPSPTTRRPKGQSLERSVAAREQALLEAAASADSDAMSLIVPQLFSLPETREAYFRVVGEPDWRDRLNSDVPDRELLAQAAAGASEFREGEALDRVAMALHRHVQEAIQLIRNGAEIPGAESDAQQSETERLRLRHGWLVWLRERETELLNPDLRVGAAEAVVEWLRAS